MAFIAVTYNVLATAYIRPQLFPRTPPGMLEPARRCAAVARRVEKLDADLICMQEVEVEMFKAIDEYLTSYGYAAALALKGARKPDGCAIFARRSTLELVRCERVEYADGAEGMPASGHIAQIAVLRNRERLFGVANTHLKWHPPGTPPARRYAMRQIRQLLDVRSALAPECEGWIACGDFNVTAEDDVVRELSIQGFRYSHEMQPAATCNPNGRAKMIDYIFLDTGLVATALTGTPVADDTPLPDPDEPSDHVPVMARIEWAPTDGRKHAAA